MNPRKDVVQIIKPRKGFINFNFKEIWQYRQLLIIFTWRDLKVRYKQTFFGVLWAFIPPIMTMIIYSAFFGNFANIPSDDIPYPIFVFIGIIIWNYFSISLSNATNVLVGHQNMIQKVYFPRIFLPLSPILAGFVDLSIASIVLLVLMIFYNITPQLIGLIILPILLITTMLITTSLGLLFSAIKVKYRDIGYVLPYFIQLGLFVTPVIYPLSITEGGWKLFLWINPLTSVIENARAGILGTQEVNYLLLVTSLVISFASFIFSFYFFSQFEKDFADVI